MHTRTAALLVTAALLTATSTVHAQGTEARIEAARALEGAGRWNEAYGALGELWSTSDTPAVAAALGRAELQLGMARDAAEHLSHALRGFRDTDAGWPDAAMDLALAKRHVVTLRVHVNEPGCRLFIDDALVGESPVARDLFVDEGIHEVRASRAGFAPAQQSVRAKAGAQVDVDLTLAAPEPRAEVPPIAVAATIVPERRKNPWIIAGGSILGVGTLAAGTGFMIAAMTGSGRVDDMNRDAAIHLTLGGVIVGATLTYALWPTAPQTGAAPHSITAAATPIPGGAAFALGGAL